MNTEFWNKFEQLCEMSGKTPTGVVRAVGLSSGNPSAWRAGRVPGMVVINKLAAYFGVAPAYFVGMDGEKEKSPAQEGAELSEEETRLLEAFRLLSDPERALILRQVSGLVREK